MNVFRCTARRFGRDQRGTVAIIFGMVMVPALALTGAAVDYGKAVQARSQLQRAVDSAALAAAQIPDATQQEKITKATDLVGDIAAASNDQAQAISQVNQGLGQIDSVTQQNTANAEETSAAAEELSGQASMLQQLLTQFTRQKDSGQHKALPLEETTPQVRETAQNPPGPSQAWGQPASAAMTDQTIRPEQQISLDDDNFDKY